MSLTSTDHNMETIDQGSQVAIAMSDDEADGLIRAACEKTVRSVKDWINQ